MMLTRRKFATASIATAVGMSVSIPFESACTFSSVFANIEKYVPVGLQAVSAVLSILTGNGIAVAGVSGIIALIKVAFADLSAAVSQYQNAPAGQKTGLLGAISETMTVLEANIQKLWSDLSIPDARLSSLIEGLLGVITTTLSGFMTQLPAPVSPAAQTAKTMKMGLAKQLPSNPVQRSPKQFKRDFNAALGNSYAQHAIN